MKDKKAPARAARKAPAVKRREARDLQEDTEEELQNDQIKKTWSGLPVIAVAGRPNVGKSTLFNRMLHSRRSIVDPTPGVTRDPIEAQWQPDSSDMPVLLVDTGGLKLERDSMDSLVAEKSWQRIAEADLVLFLVDCMNITPEDEEFAVQLRKYTEKTILVVNKADGPERDAAAWNHAGWGYKKMIFVSAEHGRNIGELEDLIVENLDWSKAECTSDEHTDIRIAIMGKPNVGKSTLLNHLLGEERSIVCDMPGTTRDVVEGHFERKGRQFTILDTAGIRRKGKVTENVEYYSVNRAIKTLDRADIVILMIDAVEGLSEQDKKIVKLATDKGRAVLFTLNKWDKMPTVKNTFEASKDKLRYFFGQMAYAPVLPLAAKEGEGVDKLLNTCVSLFDQLTRRIETSRLNKAVREWVDQNPPPASHGGRFKLRYAVQTGTNPVVFSFFITKPDAINDTYISFLKNKIRSELGFQNVPLQLDMKASRKRFEDLEKKS